MTLNLSEIIENVSRVVFPQTIKTGVGINKYCDPVAARDYFKQVGYMIRKAGQNKYSLWNEKNSLFH